MINVIKKTLTSPKLLAKYIISFTAVFHLIISNLQISSISSLTDQICGFAMFFFILLGFACLFNAIRMQDITLKSFLISVFFLLLTMGFGIWLLSIYFIAIDSQANLNVNNVIPGITVSFIVLALYFISLILLIISFIQEKKKKLNEVKE